MKKTINLKLIISIMTILLLGLSACHHHGDRRHSEFGSGDRLTGHVVSELDLTTNQETLLNDIVKDLEEARKELGDSEDLKRIFVSQLNNENLDEEYLRRETARLIRELESVSDKFISNFTSFHASLNEEQRQKLSDFAGRRKGNMSRHN